MTELNKTYPVKTSPDGRLGAGSQALRIISVIGTKNEGRSVDIISSHFNQRVL